MKCYGDVEVVNLSTGERWRRVSGDGESILEPCHKLLWASDAGKLGRGRQDVIKPEPDVYQQINYGITFRLAKGFAMLKEKQ